MKIVVNSMTPYERDGSKIKAFVQLKYNDVLSVNAQLVEGQNGLFVSFPSKKPKINENEDSKEASNTNKNLKYVHCDKKTYEQTNEIAKSVYEEIKDKSKEEISQYFKERAKNDIKETNLQSIDVRMYSIPTSSTPVIGIGRLILKDGENSITMENMKLYERKDHTQLISCPQYYTTEETKNGETKKEYHNHCSIAKEALPFVREEAIKKFNEHLAQKQELEELKKEAENGEGLSTNEIIESLEKQQDEEEAEEEEM